MSGDDRVSYEPASVTELLAEMKDTAELLIDLAFSSVLFESDALAEEVLTLEERMDVLQLQARMSLLMAARNPEDAEALAPILGIVGAAEKISDAAGDVAAVVLDEVDLPAQLAAGLPDAVATLARTTVAEDSPYVDRTLLDIDLETETGVRIVAIRRAEEWLLDPDRDTAIRAGDVCICRGPQERVAEVVETASGEPFDPPAADPSDIEDLERAVETLVLMKSTSELAVDLAYGSVLFDSTDLAESVRDLEVEVDGLQSRLEAWTLRAAVDVADPITLRGLLHIAASTEAISDAALEISEGVLRGLGSHPVVAAAVEASDEVLVRVTIAPDAHLADRTIGDVELRSRTGVQVLAVHRPDGETPTVTDWVLSPDAETTLQPGDEVVAKGTEAGTGRFAELAGDA